MADAVLEINGLEYPLETLSLTRGESTVELCAGESFRCVRLVQVAEATYEFENGVSGEDPAGEFMAGGITYPVVGGRLTLSAIDERTAEIELEGLSEEVEFSGCDDVVRSIPFKLKGRAALG